MIIKRLLAALICVALFLLLAPDGRAAEGNMDGGGGDMGSGTGESYWTPGHDGVRVTVIEKKTKKAVGNSFDWTNIKPPDKVISFVRRNKLQYLNGTSLAPNSKNYDKKIPEAKIPQVISSSGTSNIAAVKDYFTDKKTITDIARHASITYDKLISEQFTILIEPIAYFKYNGVDYAMTATEAALYDRLVDGDLRKKMGNLTHQNLPLSMFLEVGELGVTAWSGGRGIISDDNIIKYLGIGTVNFGDEEGEGGGHGSGGTGSGVPLGEGSYNDPSITDGTQYDYVYRADTEVVTAIMVSSSGEVNPDSPGRASFSLPSGVVTKEYVVPAGESQLVWVKWRTPKESMVLDIPVSVSRGNTEKATLNVSITKLEEDTPPNPEGRDRRDGFKLKNSPTEQRISTNSWGEWWAQWHANWVYHSGSHSDDCESDCTQNHGSWSDEGWWDFFWREYSAALNVTAKIFPDERVPTATEHYGNYDMKSAYGVNAAVEISMNTNGGNSNTSWTQHIIAVFPEFDYDTYNRLLVPDGYGAGYNAAWEFKENEYSQFRNPVHFTPIWYPDNTKYPVAFKVIDAWTPAGMLYYVLTADNITINGSAYDDWHISAGFAGAWDE